MKKQSKKVPYAMFLIPAAVLIISIAVAIDDAQASNLAEIAEETTMVEEFTVRRREAVKTAFYEVTEDESQTVEETLQEAQVEAVSQTEYGEDLSHAESSWSETESETETVHTDPTPYYTYKGREALDHSIQYHLYDLWRRMKMPEEWYPFMIGLIYQECGFDKDSKHLNADGSMDIGYFQYNTKWFQGTANKFGVPELDITNNYHQAYLFCCQMQWRRANGCSLEECISRHRRGDYDGYDAEYVSLVFQRTASLVRE